MNCSVCGRQLTDPKSIVAGIGPICNAKALEAAEESNHMKFIGPSIIEADAVILKRLDGGVATNVPWLVKLHSLDGYEWGYGGSGPADLALNILENVLKIIGHRGSRSRICFSLADELHQSFKRDFIAVIPMEGGREIPLPRILEWIEKKLNIR